MTKEKVEQRDFGAALEAAMAKKGMSIGDTAEALGISYEHTRKLQKSLTFPSRILLAEICKVLGMDRTVAERAVMNDKMRYKYAFAIPPIPDQHPKTAYIDRQLLKLTDQQVSAAVAMIDGLVRANKASR